MPLENLFAEAPAKGRRANRARALYQYAGVLTNPFPSAAQTSDHPHSPIDADNEVDSAVKSFINDSRTHVIVVTATQGIGKTNLLNAYERALKDKLADTGRGFFVIRYVAEPEPSFDPLLRSILEHLNQDGESHLRRTIEAYDELKNHDQQSALRAIRTPEVRRMVSALIESQSLPEEEREWRYDLAQHWLMGLPVRKAHREELDVFFRLETVESKTRALRDVIYFSASVGTLQGVFLLLDEIEKATIYSRSILYQYLFALRALIDALPQYLFLMLAMTRDARDRYGEMIPALRARFAHEIALQPLKGVDQALELYRFYIHTAKEEAQNSERARNWDEGDFELLSPGTAADVFQELSKRATVEGVRQRDFLNALHERANTKIEQLFE